MSQVPQDKVKTVQAQVEEVKGIMHENIERVVERGDKIEHLQEKSDALQSQAGQFKRSAVKLKKAMWWKNVKLTIMIVLIVVVIIVLVVVIPLCLTGHCGSQK